MTAFWTLMKREYLDHKGGLFWTPLIVTAVIAILMAYSTGQIMLSVNTLPVVHLNIDGASQDSRVTKPDGTVVDKKISTNDKGERQETVIVTSKEGKEITKVVTTEGKSGAETNADVTVNGVSVNNMKELARHLNGQSEKERVNGARTLSAAFAAFGMPVVIIMALVVPFLLLGSLFDERQDRSILFWKSMPVSDRTTVLSKLVSNAGGAFVLALGFGLVLHILALIAATILGSHYNFSNTGSLWHVPTLAGAWFNWILLIVQYLLWVLPVYAWLLFASATSPRAPFLFAFLIPGALVIISKVVLRSDWLGNEFFGRLIGAPVWLAAEKMSSSKPDMLERPEEFLGFGRDLLLKGFAEPGLWIGLVIAAALLYATIEMRRRKAL